MSTDNLSKLGANAFAKMEKVNSELFCLTYGSMISQLVRDKEHSEAVNEHLVAMGKSIGSKLVDEVLAKLGCVPCTDFKSTVEAIAKMFLGITGNVVEVDPENNVYSITFQENPLDQFVELPETLKDLSYSNVLCGVIIGSLEQLSAGCAPLFSLAFLTVLQLQMKVQCYFVKDMLKGDDFYELTIKLDEVVKETLSDEE